MLTLTWRVPWEPSTIYTWFISDKWVRFISFWLGILLGSLIVIYSHRQNQKEKILMINRGGVDLTDCIEPNHVYEVVDENLKKAIRSVLGDLKGLILVEPSIAILANFLVQKFKFQIPNLGVTMAYQSTATLLRDTALPLGTGLLTGSGTVFLFLNFLAAPAFLAIIMALGIGWGVYSVSNKYIEAQQCNNLIQQLQQIEIVINDESFQISPVDLTGGAYTNVPRMFINAGFEKTIYNRQQKLSNCNASNQSGPSLRRTNPNLTKKPAINQKCNVETTYIPLNQRTKTLDDLKKHDDTTLRKQSQPSIERYQNKAERFRAERIRIMNNRNNHDEL